MATSIGIGYSQSQQWQEAAFEASLMARKQLGTSNADFILLLTTQDYCRQDILSAVRSVLGSNLLIGSSTQAIILPDQILTQGIGILAIKSDSILFHGNMYQFSNNTHFRTAGFDLTHGMLKDVHTQRQSYFLLGDSFYRNTPDFFQGIGEAAGVSSTFIGGISSNTAGQKHQYQFFNDTMLESAAVGALVSGNTRCHVEARQPFKVLGQPRRVTKATEYVLRTIDDKPAVSIYEDFLKLTAAQINNDPLKPHQLYPLGFFDEKHERYLIRNPVDILADGSIVFHGDIPQGAQIHVMITNKDICMQSGFNAAKAILEAVGERPLELLLILESSSRARILGQHARQEIKHIRETIGMTVPVFGLYTNGEAAPWPSTGGGKYLGLNNGSLVLTAFT